MKQELITQLLGTEKIDLVFSSALLLVAFALGFIVSVVYRHANRGFSYTESFNITLILVTVIVAMIMISIGSNIALSLGLVGSLSVIRFRSVLKDTVDMAYLFWAIATGLAVGTGNILFAFICTVFISAFALYLSRKNFRQRSGISYVLIMQFEQSQEDAGIHFATEYFESNSIVWKIRSCEINNQTGKSEAIFQLHEIGGADSSAKILEILRQREGISKVSLLSSETNLFI